MNKPYLFLKNTLKENVKKKIDEISKRQKVSKKRKVLQKQLKLVEKNDKN